MKQSTISWRNLWYSVLIWSLSFALSTLVVLPWFYLALPIVIFWTTVYYFRRAERTFVAGLEVSLMWFGAVGILSLAQIVGPYYSNFGFYFLDFRNWFLLPLILLVPVVYSLVLENRKVKSKPRHRRITSPHLPVGPAV